jgi:hypothetical protein
MTELGVDAWMNVGMSGLGALACATFAVIYHLRATWWKSEVGRNQMAFAAVVGLLCLYTVLGTLWQGDECVLLALRIFSMFIRAAVVALMVQRTRLFLKAQRESRDRTGV